MFVVGAIGFLVFDHLIQQFLNDCDTRVAPELSLVVQHTLVELLEL